MSMLKPLRPSDASNASLLPSGDQAGKLSPTGLVASFLKPLPSGSTTKISKSPTRLSNLAKAILPFWLGEAGLVGSVPPFCAAQLASTTAKAVYATTSMISTVANRFTRKKIRLFIFPFPAELSANPHPTSPYHSSSTLSLAEAIFLLRRVAHRYIDEHIRADHSVAQ